MNFTFALSSDQFEEASKQYAKELQIYNQKHGINQQQQQQPSNSLHVNQSFPPFSPFPLSSSPSLSYQSTIFTNPLSSTTITAKLYQTYYINDHMIQHKQIQWFRSVHYILKSLCKFNSPYNKDFVQSLLEPLIQLIPCPMCATHLKENIVKLFSHSYSTNADAIKMMHDLINVSNNVAPYSPIQLQRDYESGIYNNKIWLHLHLKNFILYEVNFINLMYKDETRLEMISKLQSYEKLLHKYMSEK